MTGHPSSCTEDTIRDKLLVSKLRTCSMIRIFSAALGKLLMSRSLESQELAVRLAIKDMMGDCNVI